MSSMAFNRLCLILLSIAAWGKACQPGLDKIYTKVEPCNTRRTPNHQNFQEVDNWSKRLPVNPKDTNSNEYSGSIAVIGTGTSKTGALYFTAMGAIESGADQVHIFCYEQCATILKSMRNIHPSITVHNFLLADVGKVIQMLNNVDLVILGPGLDDSGHSTSTVYNNVINHCKGKKPLVLDIGPKLITDATFNQLQNYPPPGVVVTANGVEFNELYLRIHRVNYTRSSQINLANYGSMFVLRKDCLDEGISTSASTSWNSPVRGCSKRSMGQGNVLAGILGTYWMRARQIIPDNVIWNQGSMFAASVASYTASTTTRESCSRAFNVYGRGMITSDMLKWVSIAQPGIDERFSKKLRFAANNNA